VVWPLTSQVYLWQRLGDEGCKGLNKSMLGNPKLIFVYGTLKKGFRLHHYLEGAKFIRATMTLHAEHDLEAIGGEDISPFPAMVPGKFHVTGELYDVPDKILKAIEKLERRYERTQVILENTVPPAFFYLYKKKNPKILPDSPLVVLDSSKKTKTWVNT